MPKFFSEIPNIGRIQRTSYNLLKNGSFRMILYSKSLLSDLSRDLRDGTLDISSNSKVLVVFAAGSFFALSPAFRFFPFGMEDVDILSGDIPAIFSLWQVVWYLPPHYS